MTDEQIEEQERIKEIQARMLIKQCTDLKNILTAQS
mgnify:CR=1 FL=1